MLRLFTVALIWGWSFLLIKVQLGGVPPAFIAWSRVLLGALVLVALLRRSKDRVLPPRGCQPPVGDCRQAVASPPPTRTDANPALVTIIAPRYPL